MSVDRFRFVSPGVFINEIDQSQVPQVSISQPSPAIIGRTARGPAFVPTIVNSFDEFVNIYGDPIPGGLSGDVWRDGNRAAPTYAAYAAQAYLANSGPVTIVRLLGDQSATATSAATARAGWKYPESASGSAAGSNGVGAGSGGAYGLFMLQSGSGNKPHVEGLLAAVFYLSSSANIVLVGSQPTKAAAGADVESNAAILNATTVSSAKELKIKITTAASWPNSAVESTFNFDVNSPRYIRKVFNTNPQLVNSAITTATNREYYFLGESFDRAINDKFAATTAKWGVILALSGTSGGSRLGLADFEKTYKIPETPPVIAQDPGPATNFNINSSTRELFSVVARDEAEWAQNNVKIAFKDIKQSPNPSFAPYGTFSLQVRAMDDTDNNPAVLEEYNNLNLNPNSPNYIARRIGDSYSSWDSTNKKFRYFGEYQNQSRFIRMNMNQDVAQGRAGKDWLPFGFKGIPKWKGFNVVSGSYRFLRLAASGSLLGDGDTGVPLASSSVAFCGRTGTPGTPAPIMSASSGQSGFYRQNVVDSGLTAAATPTTAQRNDAITASINFPMLPLRVSSSDGGLSLGTDAYFGFHSTLSATSLVPDHTIRDLVRVRPGTLQRLNPASAEPQERGPGFSLDNLVLNGNQDAAYHSGSGFGYSEAWAGSHRGARKKGTSITAKSSSYEAVLDLDYNRFVVPLYGGFDGFDIGEADPFNNTRALGGEVPQTVTSENDFAMFASARKGIDVVSDPDQVDVNLMTIPGITVRGITDHLINACESRADTLGVIDLEGGFKSAAENNSAFSTRAGSNPVSASVNAIKSRRLNNSYGACYYPWVQILDTLTGKRLWVPPSVAALGTYASSEAVSELWFAPAGFNRGGLSQGAAGVPVTNVVDKLTSAQRDKLYEVNINPIASFPAEGIVVFGQKTLQATPSALDRVNVRRLLIFLKKRISRISTGILFDPNIQVTWDRFLAQVEPLLRSVKSRYGLAEYRVILDETTTTPDLVDRNVMYAKVLLKPTRAIEFIALDFVVMRSGASFDD